MPRRLIFASGTALLISCSQPNTMRVYKWSQISGEAMPSSIQNVLARPDLKYADANVQQAGESIERTQQSFHGAKVSGAFLQKIYNQNGDLIYLIGSVDEQNLDKLSPTVNKLDKQKYDILNEIKIKNHDLQQASHVFDPQVLIDPKTKAVYLALDYINKRGTAAYRLRVSPALEVIAVERLGSSFHPGEGLVFPAGPKLSALQEIPFQDLMGDGYLNTERTVVTTSEATVAYSPAQQFNYQTEDVRFNQVQAFYYINRALSWFGQALQTAVPFKIEAQTQVGGPHAANAAFYYQGKIRLGDGDGVVYRNIPQDPSIVTHETCHALIDALGHFPFDGEGGSLNEGFADFLTASMLNNPNLGEVAFVQGPYKRTLQNSLRISDKNGGLYHDSLILSGTFWDIRKAIGHDKAIHLAVRTISRLGPMANFAALKSAVLFAAGGYLTDAEVQAVTQILQQRGWS